MNVEKVEGLIRELLVEIGEDPDREGLLKTPARVARAYQYLTSGYGRDGRQLLQGAMFHQKVNNMIIARDIELYSLCEHHLLPFYGRCHIGYVSRGKVIGISKLARLVDVHARRLQIQERLTEEIAQMIQEAVDADGVGVIIEARHLCMMMRGVEKQNSMMVTSSVLGRFRESSATRSEFLTLIGNGRSF